MLNINFVPDDYVQSNESHRANLIYLILLAVAMAALGGSFMTIKMRQRACKAQEQLVNAKMAHIQQAIKQFEQLQTERKEMMKTALTTTELIEPIPRSILLASLTNSLPPGVSLLRLGMAQQKPKLTSGASTTNKYQAEQAKKAAFDSSQQLSQEKLLETQMEIEGLASSDLQVAAYIERLSASGGLLSNVALVESKEHKIGDRIFRRFKLTAMLQRDVQLTKEDVERIRINSEKSVLNF